MHASLLVGRAKAGRLLVDRIRNDCRLCLLSVSERFSNGFVSSSTFVVLALLSSARFAGVVHDLIFAKWNSFEGYNHNCIAEPRHALMFEFEKKKQLVFLDFWTWIGVAN
jgi:hypothetical protein